MALDYWFDGQLQRYWLQFTRIFMSFQYEILASDGSRILKPFPVRMATKDKMVGAILSGNTENKAPAVPQVTTWMTDIQRAPDRIQQPNFVSSVQVTERAIDPLTGKYTAERGNSYTVERYMAVPYDMTMQVDVWVSNELQKHQFMETIMALFNPSLDIQTSDNPIDWTSLTIVSLDTISWSNRSFTVDSTEIEVASMTFKVPIWITPPSKVKKQKLIHQIITNIGRMGEDDPNCVVDGAVFDSNDFSSRSITTPGNYRLSVNDNSLRLMSLNNMPETEDNQKHDWRELFELYGRVRPGVSQIRLKTTDNMDDHETDIVGTFTFTNDPYVLQWNIDPDTLKPNTLPPINAIIDPHQSFPGTNMPAPAEGQRYLLLERIGPSGPWGNLLADENDIIEFQNGQWVIVFDSSIATQSQMIKNAYSGKQYQWTGELWREAVSGVYNPGYWRIYL